MALSKATNINIYGKDLCFDNTYCRIDSLNWNKDSNIATFILVTYDNKDKINVLDNRTYIFTPEVTNDSDNFIKQAYQYLKTLNEFVDATDILEEY